MEGLSCRPRVFSDWRDSAEERHAQSDLEGITLAAVLRIHGRAQGQKEAGREIRRPVKRHSV